MATSVLKGLPRGSRVPLIDRVLPRIDKSGDCWLWTLSLNNNGYGQVNRGGRGGAPILVHRVMWEHHRGPIPEGMVLDHLCRVRSCCNPDHLEVTTHAVNIGRGEAPNILARRTGVCSRGHVDQFWTVSTTGARFCNECKKLRRRLHRERATNG